MPTEINEERARKVVSIIAAAEKPVMGTAELADRLEISQQAMNKSLHDLADQGILRTDKIGQARVWWPSEEGMSYLDPQYE